MENNILKECLADTILLEEEIKRIKTEISNLNIVLKEKNSELEIKKVIIKENMKKQNLDRINTRDKSFLFKVSNRKKIFTKKELSLYIKEYFETIGREDLFDKYNEFLTEKQEIITKENITIKKI